jgi:hypothetical protein
MAVGIAIVIVGFQRAHTVPIATGTAVVLTVLFVFSDLSGAVHVSAVTAVFCTVARIFKATVTGCFVASERTATVLADRIAAVAVINGPCGHHCVDG